MQIDIRHASEEIRVFEGEMPLDAFDLEDDPVLHPESGLRYRLEVQVLGHELLVRGNLAADMKMDCARCGDFFSTTVEVSSFVRAYEISEGVEVVDIGPDMREELLLATPAYPACEQAERGTCPKLLTLRRMQAEQRPPPAEDKRWDALDGLGL